MNRSRIATVVCVPLTSNLKWAGAPGNVSLSAWASSRAPSWNCFFRGSMWSLAGKP